MARICRSCGTPFEPTPNQIRKGKYRCNRCKYAAEKDAPRTAAQQEQRAQWWRDNSNPDTPSGQRRKAREQIQEAIRWNRVKRQPCEKCGADRAEAHHDDYSKPLEVRWLCRPHHQELHRSLKD